MLSFPVPEGFEPPEGAAPGAKFDVLASVTMSEDGMTLTLESIDGIAITGGEPPVEEMPPAEMEEDAGFIEAMQRGVRK